MNKFAGNTTLLIHWILVTTAGPIVGSGLVSWSIALTGINWTAILPVGFVVWGLLLGIGQWIILSTRLKNVWLWIPFTGIGFPAGFFLGSMTSVFIGKEFLMPVILGVVLGTILGILQWSVLYKKVKNSIWWIPASILSWTIGVMFTLENQNLLGFEQLGGGDPILQYGMILGILLGISVGVMSGVSIVLLLRKTKTIATIAPVLGSIHD